MNKNESFALNSAQSLKLFNLFLDNLKHNNRSEKTVLNYSADLHLFLRWFEVKISRNILNCRPEHIGQYLKYLSGEEPELKRKTRTGSWGLWLKRFVKKKTDIKSVKLSVNSRKRHLSTVFNFFDFLLDYSERYSKKLKTNPVRKKLHRIKVKDIDINHTKLITQDQYQQLLTVVPRNQDRLMYQMLFYGGLRLAEVTKLQVKHIDKAQQSLKFYRKGGYYHQLRFYWPKEIIPYLNQWDQSDWSDPERYLFGKMKPYTERGMYQKILRHLQKAELGHLSITPHSFRKACASYLYKETKDLLLVRDYLNHKDAQVTQTYIESI
jgi:integrase/recombinase XerC